jgi:hypothetical protein
MSNAKLFGSAMTALVLCLALAGDKAMAQFTGEFILCIDGSSSEACRKSQIPADKDGIIYWFRDYGSIACAGVGFEPQKEDCIFQGFDYNGLECAGHGTFFAARVLAGDDLAIACGNTSVLPDGPYSAKATSSSCFEGESVCQPFYILR